MKDDDKKNWWEAVSVLPDPVMHDLWALRRPVESEMRGPFSTGPAEPAGFIELDIAFPSGLISLKPSATILLFPLIHRACDIAFIERETGLTAVGRGNYIELVSV
jgi:hypothetical protein